GPIMDALTRAGVPVQKRSHNRLRDRTGVPEIAAELRLAGPGGGDLRARVRRAGQALVDRYHAPVLDPAEQVRVHPTDIWAAVELLTPLAERCGDDLPRFLAALAEGQEVDARSEEHTSELQSRENLVCRLLLEKKKLTELKTII